MNEDSNNLNEKTYKHENDDVQLSDILEKKTFKPKKFDEKEYRKIEIYEILLDSIIEYGGICVFSDLEEMNTFYLALVRMKNRCGLETESSFADMNKNSRSELSHENTTLTNKIINFYKEENLRPKISLCTNIQPIPTKKEIADIVDLQVNEQFVIDQHFLARKKACLERLYKVVFMKLNLSEDFEMRIVFNRDCDSTNYIHRSKVLDEQLQFFFQYLKRVKRIVISGSSEGVVDFFSKCVKQPYTIEKDASGSFTFFGLI